MKTLQLKTLPLLLVEMPEGGENLNIERIDFDGKYKYPESVDLIGKLSEIPGELIKEKLGRVFIPGGFISLAIGQKDKFTAFLATQERVYLDGNPYKPYGELSEVEQRMMLHSDYVYKRQEAQSRTFDPDRTYFFMIKSSESEQRPSLVATRLSDSVEFPVSKYTRSDDGEMHVWCNGWYGHHIVGKDCKIELKPI